MTSSYDDGLSVGLTFADPIIKDNGAYCYDMLLL